MTVKNSRISDSSYLNSDPLLRFLLLVNEVVAILEFDIIVTHWSVEPVAIRHCVNVVDNLNFVNVFNKC